MTDRDRLLADYLAGALDGPGQERLLAELRADPAFAREAAEHLLTERLLRLRLGEAGPETFRREILEVLAARPAGERFAREVVARVQRRPPTGRRAHRFHAGKSFPYVVPALVAAGLLMGIVLLATFTPSRPPAEREEARKPSPPSIPESLSAQPERPAPPAPPRAPEPPAARPPEPSAAPQPEGRPEPPKAPTPEPTPASATPPAAPPPVPAPPPAESRAAVASVEQVKGEAFLLGPAGETPAPARHALVAGEGLRTTEGALVAFPDGTRLEIGKETVIRDIRDGPRGKALLVARGTITAQVARQPAGRMMVFETPLGEARVLGTTLRLAVEAASTRLEVREGRVRFVRKDDNAVVEVTADHYVLVTRGPALAVRPLRTTNGLLALYTFREGSGATVRDVSGSGEPLDLRIEVPEGVSWKPRGLSIQTRSILATPGPPVRLLQACRKSREITLEAWVTPAKALADYEGCIVGLGTDEPQRNFLLAQGSRNHGFNLWAAWLRLTPGPSGTWSPLTTRRGTAEARLTHLVFARSAAGAERLTVNGVERAARFAPGDFAGWDESLRLCLADEMLTGERSWYGEYHLVAVYGRALPPLDVARNFTAGPD